MAHEEQDSVFRLKDPDEDIRPPNRKKQRMKKTPAVTERSQKPVKSKSKVRGKTGRLALILEAPMEIVLEILSYLLPVDILNLSYVDKELRAMLTAPSATSVWVAARRNVDGLPECPPDFTESAYARFLFIKTCELCEHGARGLSEMAYIRVRLCSRCAREKCVDGHKVQGLFGELLFGPLGGTMDMLPRRAPGGDFYRMKQQSYFKPAAISLVNLIKDMSDDALVTYHETRKEYIDKIMEHAERLDSWLITTRNAAQLDTRVMRGRRLESIRSRLEALGHDRKDMGSNDFLRHRVVAQTADVTDRSWPNIRRQLELLVEENKAERLKKELLGRNRDTLTRLLGDLYRELPSSPEKLMFPPMPNLLGLSSVHALLHGDTTVNAESFRACLTSIKQEIDEFRTQMFIDLQIVWETGRAPLRFFYPHEADAAAYSFHNGHPSHMRPSARAFVNLASTVFTCTEYGCWEPLHYTTILDHSHHLIADYNYESDDEVESSQAAPRKYQWREYLQSLTARPNAKLAMSSIITAAGLDEEIATLADLDAVAPRFRLVLPDGDEDTNQAVRTWTDAFQVYMTLTTSHALDNLVLDDFFFNYAGVLDPFDSDEDGDYLGSSFNHVMEPGPSPPEIRFVPAEAATAVSF